MSAQPGKRRADGVMAGGAILLVLCCAVGPADGDRIDAVTKGLALL